MLVERKQGRGLRIKTLTVALIAAAIIALLTTTPLEANGSSTTLALEPELVRVTHLDLEQGYGRFYIDLHLSNVQDLVWFKFTIVFDGDVLETVPDGWHGDPSSWSEGGRSSGDSGYGSYVLRFYELRNPISGSGVLLTYWFKTRAAGTTKIELREVELRDSNGDVIPCTFIGNEVEIVPFDTWVNGEYEKLSTQYDELQTQYTDLQAKHGTLSAEYGSLNSNYISLQEDYTALESSYSSLEEDYASLSAEHAVLEEDYSSLESDYDELNLEHQSTVEQLEATKSQLSTTQILLYVFIGATAVLLFLMIFLLLRRRGLGS